MRATKELICNPTPSLTFCLCFFALISVATKHSIYLISQPLIQASFFSPPKLTFYSKRNFFALALAVCVFVLCETYFRMSKWSWWNLNALTSQFALIGQLSFEGVLIFTLSQHIHFQFSCQRTGKERNRKQTNKFHCIKVERARQPTAYTRSSENFPAKAKNFSWWKSTRQQQQQNQRLATSFETQKWTRTNIDHTWQRKEKRKLPFS